MFVNEDRPMSRTRSVMLAGSNCLKLGYGRFLQADPLGYADGLNWYNYVGSNPINSIDPTGTQEACIEIIMNNGVVARSAGCTPDSGSGSSSGGSGSSSSGSGGSITVTGGGGVGYSGNGAALLGGGGSGLGGSGVNGGGSLGGGGAIGVGGMSGGIGQPTTPSTSSPQNNQSKDAVVTLETAARKVGRCIANQYGLGALGLGGALVGQPISGTKPFVTPGSSRGTSLAGMAANSMFGKARLPFRLPTLVGGLGTGTPLRVAYTKSAARFAGRAVPILGEALLAYDVASIAVCSLSGD